MVDIEKAMNEEQDLAMYDGKDKVITSYEYRDRLRGEKETQAYKSELVQLDSIMGGVSSGQVVTISGFTKCGKTSFCQTLTYNYSLQGLGCLWFTYELSVKEFMRKFPQDGLPMFTLPAVLKESSLEWIEKRIIESMIKYDTKIVFIDHLHYLVPMSGNQNMSILIGCTMRELKKLSVKHNITIFILAHTTKDNNEGKPGLEHLRDSSFVAQESDFVLMISRPKYEEDDLRNNTDKSAKLRVLANRRTGERGLVNLDYSSGMYKEVLK